MRSTNRARGDCEAKENSNRKAIQWPYKKVYQYETERLEGLLPGESRHLGTGHPRWLAIQVAW